MSPLTKHTLAIQTDHGTATIDFHTSHYIAATDTDGKAVHLVRTNPDADGGVEEEWLQLESDMTRPMFIRFSPDGTHLFLVGIKERAQTLYKGVPAYDLEFVTYQTAYPHSPKAVAQFNVAIGSSPIDMTLNDEGEMIILGKRSFVLVNAENPTQLKAITNKRLPWNDGSTTYVDAVFFDNNQHIAFLEAHQNTVAVLENSVASDFRSGDTLQLLPSKAIPLSVDLEVDPENSNNIWVLETANYRGTDDAIKNIYSRIRGREVEEENRSVSLLQKLEWDETKLSKTDAIELPTNYAGYFAKFSEDNQLLVTMSKLDFINLESEPDTGSSFLKKIGSYLWDSIAIGRVLEVDINDGTYETAASGVGIYYDVVDVPDIGPVFTLLKFGPSFSFPYLSPSWGWG